MREKVNKETRKMLRNMLWTIAAVLGIGAAFFNPAHLATASIIFILGTFQHDAMKEEE